MGTGIGPNDQGIPEEAPRAWRRWSRRAENIAAVLWSSFLAACLATGIFFGNVDPRELNAISAPGAETSALAGYATGFFFFWIVCGIASLLAVFLIRTSRRQDGKARGPHH